MSKHAKNPNLMTYKESRAIIKSNLREMKRLEKIKRAKKTQDQYTTVMRSPDNILEIDLGINCRMYTDVNIFNPSVTYTKLP